MRSAKQVVILAVMLSSVFGLAQQAAQPTREEVLKFFEVMRIRTTMEQVRAAAEDQARTSLRDMVSDELPGATPAQIAELQGMVDKMIGAYTIDNTIEDLVPIYQKHLTKSDLETTTAFFSSPVGQKYLDQEPVITGEALRVVNAKTGAQVAASMNAIYKRLDEMKSQSGTKSKPGTAKPSTARPGTAKPGTKKPGTTPPKNPQ